MIQTPARADCGRLYLVGLLFFAWPHTTYAEKRDREQNIHIQADGEASVDHQKEVVILEKNVMISQGSLRLKAARVVVTRTPDGQQIFEASGKPVYFEQKLEGKEEWIKGQGTQVVYTSKNNQVILSGRAKIERDGDTVEGKTITYNTETEVYKAFGNQGGKKSKVYIVLQPRSES